MGWSASFWEQSPSTLGPTIWTLFMHVTNHMFRRWSCRVDWSDENWANQLQTGVSVCGSHLSWIEGFVAILHSIPDKRWWEIPTFFPPPLFDSHLQNTLMDFSHTFSHCQAHPKRKQSLSLSLICEDHFAYHTRKWNTTPEKNISTNLQIPLRKREMKKTKILLSFSLIYKNCLTKYQRNHIILPSPGNEGNNLI